MQRANISNLIFCAALGLIVVFMFLSNPFLKIPYDMWDHLSRIAGLHDEGVCFEFYPARPAFSMCFWHSIWAGFFKITGINDIFVWAKIIHVCQFLVSFAAVYYFCRTTIQILLDEIELAHVRFLSLLGVCAWFIGNGTFSVAYQQAWIMWYSVTYQGLTIPLFWYITALMLKMTYEKPPLKKSLFYMVQIVLISVFIAKAHPMELLYFLINVSVLLLLNLRKTLIRFKKYYYIIIPLIISVVFAISHFAGELIPAYLLPTSKETLEIVWKKIQAEGSQITVGKLNRFPNSITELAIALIILAVLFRGFYKEDKMIKINIKIFDYLLATSLIFYVIPLNRISAGIASYVLTTPDIICRFFFVSPWFVFLPLFVYITVKFFSKKQVLTRAILANTAVILVFIFLSKYIFWGALYKNTESILLSLDKSRVGVQYSGKDLAALKEIVMRSEAVQGPKLNIYSIRGDLAPIVRGVFRKYVYMHDRRESPPGRASFVAEGLDGKYGLVEIKLPESFPRDEEIFRDFQY